MVWLRDGENIIENVFIHLNRIHERDRGTDRRTLHEGIGRACIASRGNKKEVQLSQRGRAMFNVV